QALQLLSDVLIQMNPKLAAAAPSLADLQATMRQYKVSGAELYDYMRPSFELNLQARLQGQKPPAPGLIQLQKATAFAAAHGIPSGELLSKLQRLRADMDAAEESSL